MTIHDSSSSGRGGSGATVGEDRYLLGRLAAGGEILEEHDGHAWLFELFNGHMTPILIVSWDQADRLVRNGWVRGSTGQITAAGRAALADRPDAAE